MVRYAQAFATLINIVTLRDTGTIALSKSQEQKVSMLYQALSARTASMSFRTSNGHKMAGKVECKDTLTDAIAVLLEEMAAFS